MDGEQDPRCLLAAFRLVGAVSRMFPQEGGPLAGCASELFDVCCCYFPLSFKAVSREGAEGGGWGWGLGVGLTGGVGCAMWQAANDPEAIPREVLAEALQVREGSLTSSSDF